MKANTSDYVGSKKKKKGHGKRVVCKEKWLKAETRETSSDCKAEADKTRRAHELEKGLATFSFVCVCVHIEQSVLCCFSRLFLNHFPSRIFPASNPMARVLRLCGLKHSLWFMVVRCECDNDVFHALRSWELKKKGTLLTSWKKQKSRRFAIVIFLPAVAGYAVLPFLFFFLKMASK